MQPPFKTGQELFEFSFRDRDPATGRLLLPLAPEHLTGHLTDFVYELGQRVLHDVPTDELVARAIFERLQLFGHAPYLFGFQTTHVPVTAAEPKISHDDACAWLLRESAAVCANEGLCALAGFEPGIIVERMLPRFRRWWEPRERRIAAERDYQLAHRQKPTDPVTALIFDVVLPTWRTDPPMDPTSMLAYKVESVQRFFASSPAAVRRRTNETLENMAAGVAKDDRMRMHVARATRRMAAGTEEAEAALLCRFAELAVEAEAAAKLGKPPVSLFGTVRLDPGGTPFVFVDRFGIAGTYALRRELRNVLKADRMRLPVVEADLQAIRADADAVAEVRAQREDVEKVRLLRESFEKDRDASALAFIEWKSGRFGSLKEAAVATGLGAKAIRHAEGRVAARHASLRAG